MSNDDIQTIIDLIREVQDPVQASFLAAQAHTHAATLRAATPTESSPFQPLGMAAGINEAGFKVGDHVEFGPSVSPRYLVGRKGMVVTKVNRKSVKVSVPDEDGFGRFKGKSSVGCPNSIIRKSTTV